MRMTGKMKQPRPDHVGEIDVASGVLTARREQDFVEQLVGEVEVTEENRRHR